MALTLKQWKETPEYKRVAALSDAELFGKEFFRDPPRPIYLDRNIFYAPADGVILYAVPEVQPDEPIVRIKGRDFTPRDCLDDQSFDQPSMVCGIFMSRLDVHTNRVPTSGYLIECHRTPFLFTPNVSMILEEDDILEDSDPDPDHEQYLFQNERRIVTIYNAHLRLRYYVVQIAERDVKVIANFGDRQYFTQGDRYGQVRMGSQVDLIVPLKDGLNLELMVKPKLHVEAGIDPVIKVK